MSLPVPNKENQKRKSRDIVDLAGPKPKNRKVSEITIDSFGAKWKDPMMQSQVPDSIDLTGSDTEELELDCDEWPLPPTTLKECVKYARCVNEVLEDMGTIMATLEDALDVMASRKKGNK